MRIVAFIDDAPVIRQMRVEALNMFMDAAKVEVHEEERRYSG
jgi:hypothetical protein